MATSSLYKTFSLKTKEETDIFMKKFEESLCKPQKIKKTGIKMASESDTDKFLSTLRKKYGNKLVK